jgi:predicted NBD/HSP70 family sugar kinase
MKTAQKPSILRQRNQELVIATLQSRERLSRRGVAQQTGISYPTVSKILVDLVASKVVDEQDDEYTGFGRPGKVYRIAKETRAVLGLVIGPVNCELVLSGCDGRIRDESTFRFRTPRRFSTLIKTIKERIERITLGDCEELIGLGATVPGLIDRTTQTIVESPNMPQLDGKQLGQELERAIKLPVTVVQCMHGLFLAERMFGEARNMNDFVLLNYVGGLGIAVGCDGKLMDGAHGLAGEFGHTTVDISGPICACGNRGCLEVFATDKVVAEAVSKRIGRDVDFKEVEQLVLKEQLDIADILERATDYLAVGVASTINIFDPEAVFLHGRFLHLQDTLFNRLLEQVGKRALAASLDRCRITCVNQRPQESERAGAVAAIVHQLTVRRRAKELSNV